MATKYILYKEELSNDHFETIYNSFNRCNDSLCDINKQYLDHLITLRKSSNKDSLQTSFNYLKKEASDRNDTDYFYALANCYRLGKGCEQNLNNAYLNYSLSAQYSNKYANYALAYLKMKGLGVEQNYLEAYDIFRLSNYEMSKYWKAFLKYFGYGVKQNKEEALIEFSELDLNISEALKKNLITTNLQPINIEDELNLNFNDKFNLETSEIIKISFQSYLYEFDWSHQYILNTIPVEYTLDIEKKQVTLIFNEIELKYDFKFDEKVDLSSDIKEIEFLNFYYKEIEKLTVKSVENRESKFIVTQLNLLNNDNREPHSNYFVVSEIIDVAYKDDNDITVYPNPFNDRINIYYSDKYEQECTIILYDLNGREVSTLTSNEILEEEGLLSFETFDLDKGHYILKIKLDSQEVIKTIIKE